VSNYHKLGRTIRYARHYIHASSVGMERQRNINFLLMLHSRFIMICKAIQEPYYHLDKEL
jgi:hypothetical protein